MNRQARKRNENAKAKKHLSNRTGKMTNHYDFLASFA